MRLERANGSVVEVLPHDRGGVCLRYWRPDIGGELRPMSFIVLDARELVEVQMALAKAVSRTGGRR